MSAPVLVLALPSRLRLLLRLEQSACLSHLKLIRQTHDGRMVAERWLDCVVVLAGVDPVNYDGWRLVLQILRADHGQRRYFQVALFLR